jgi:hypothetical protein
MVVEEDWPLAVGLWQYQKNLKCILPTAKGQKPMALNLTYENTFKN